MTRNTWSRLALTSFLGLVLSGLFVFLAALPIRYLRLTFGRTAFLMSSAASIGLLAALGLWQWALVYATICLLIGLYREMEEKNSSIFLASLVAVTLTTGFNLFAVLGYSQWAGLNLKSLLLEKSQPVLQQLHQIPNFKDADVENLLWYLPSGFVITMMLIIFISLTVYRRPMSRKDRFAMRMFRLPDWAIWFFIASLGATFIKTDNQWISMIAMNVLAISLAAYFFQGLAVFNYFLDRLSIFGFWRLLAYFLVFFQMFIFISGLGILDYWFDFRVQGLSGSDFKKIKKQ